MILHQLVFYSTAIVLIIAALMVVLARNPVHSALCLVLSFLMSALLWMLLEAEFLSLILVLVYVGAVMTLFLFVVMMLNVKQASRQPHFVRYLPLAAAAIAIITGLLVYVTGPQHFGLEYAKPALHPVNYSNVKALGLLLYTHYVYLFECAGVILLVAIVATITLAFRGSARDCHSQKIADQVRVQRDDRLEVVSLKSESKS